MATSPPITYLRVADVLTGLGMITRETARDVVDGFGDRAHAVLPLRQHIAGALEAFGVAVSIHADDVDFADSHYPWLLEEAAALTGGKVTVGAFRFEREDADDEEAGRGTLYFTRNGEELSFSIEQESNDYLDMDAARAAIEALSPDDDPRSFRCVDSSRENPFGGNDDIVVLATAEQRAGLRRHLGLTFHEPR
ncbi:hypothetical protein ACWQ06_10390 [Streptomyces angustmyceticus]